MSTRIEQLDDDTFEGALHYLWEYLAISRDPIASDVIFVFGGLDLSVPAGAAELYNAGFAPTVLVTGGYGPFTKDKFPEPEARVFAKRMIELGVPESAIALEIRASNTGENVRFGMEELARMAVVPMRAILTAKPFLMRRCIATFERQFPEVEVVPSPPRGPILSFCDRSRRDFAERLLAELRRLHDYADQGFTTSQPVPTHVQAAAEDLRALLSIV